MINKQWEGKTLTFREDGYFNMTKAAKEFGRRLDLFLKTDETRNYLIELEKVLITPKGGIRTDKGIVDVKRGNGNLPQVGTWAHPKLAVFFARWLDTRFAVACDAMRIIKNFQSKELLKG